MLLHPGVSPREHTRPNSEELKASSGIPGILTLRYSFETHVGKFIEKRTMTIRVIGIDIGIRNLSTCMIEVPRQSTGTTLIDRAIFCLNSATRLEWEVSDLCPANTRNANKCAHSTVLDGLVSFVETIGAKFDWASHVVIEAQPAARMKMIAGALYALVRQRCGLSTRIVFQAAKKKLSWGPKLATYAPEVKQSTYSERKKGAILLMTKLLNDSPPHRDKLDLLTTLKKKDDAADSFLHALCFAISAPRPN